MDIFFSIELISNMTLSLTIFKMKADPHLSEILLENNIFQERLKNIRYKAQQKRPWKKWLRHSGQTIVITPAMVHTGIRISNIYNKLSVTKLNTEQQNKTNHSRPSFSEITIKEK